MRTRTGITERAWRKGKQNANGKRIRDSRKQCEDAMCMGRTRMGGSVLQEVRAATVLVRS